MDARVVMSPITHNGGQPAIPRVKNVTETGFEFQIDEWEYLDGFHIEEDISWIAMTEGSHTLPSGQVITAGRITAENNTAVDVALSDFDAAPAVFAQITSENGSEAVTNRIDGVTSAGFSVRMQEEEAGDQVHAAETIDWIAIDSTLDQGEFGIVELDAVDHTGDTFSFEASADVALFASMQSLNGSNTAALRFDDVTDGAAKVFVEEEQSRDRETWHLEETVAVAAVEEGLYELFA